VDSKGHSYLNQFHKAE